MTRAELTVLDRAAVAAAVVLLGSVAVVATVVAWPFGRRRALLLLPPWREVLMLLTAGAIAGGATYAAWTGLAGRGLGNDDRSGVLQLIGYGVATLATLATLTAVATATGRRRLTRLGVPVAAGRAYAASFGVAVGVCACWAAAVGYVSIEITDPYLLALHVPGLSFAVVMLTVFWAVIRARRGDVGPVRGVGTLLRSVALRLGVTAVGLGIAAAAGLQAAERADVARFFRTTPPGWPADASDVRDAPAVDLPGHAAETATTLARLGGG